MGALAIEEGVPIPAPRAHPDVLPLDTLELGQSIWISADDPAERAHWRAVADSLAHERSLTTGRGYLVRSCRRGEGEAERGVRVWCTSIPAAFVPVTGEPPGPPPRADQPDPERHGHDAPKLREG
ncbi:MAG TPA: hypothetical protein VF582_05840 [Allosphingosinicella sp.]